MRWAELGCTGMYWDVLGCTGSFPHVACVGREEPRGALGEAVGLAGAARWPPWPLGTAVLCRTAAGSPVREGTGTPDRGPPESIAAAEGSAVGFLLFPFLEPQNNCGMDWPRGAW